MSVPTERNIDHQQMRMMAFQNFMEAFKSASDPNKALKGSSKGDITVTMAHLDYM